MISVILVQHNGFDLTRRALDAIWSWKPESVEVIVVDNASEGFEPAEWVKRWRGLQIIRNDRNQGFGMANNIAAGVAKGDILLFLNSDTEAQEPFEESIEGMFRTRPRMGILGPRLIYPDGSFQLSAGRLPTIGQEAVDKVVGVLERVGFGRAFFKWTYRRRKFVGWVTGAALFIRRDLFRELGGFDEKMFMFFEDKDLCKRAQNSSREIVYEPSVSIVHVKGGSSGGGMSARAASAYRASQRYYYQKHCSLWQQRVLGWYLRMKGV